MPFKDMSSIKILGDEIYVYENFLSKKELSKINNKLNNIPEELWSKMWDAEGQVPDVSPKMRITKKIIKRLSKKVNGLNVNINEVFSKMKTGISWGEHADNADFLAIRKLSKTLKDKEKFKLVKNSKYGVVLYINDDYKGGEIYYVGQNISYKPKAGDLVVHSSEEKCRHGVKRVTSGVRYAWSSNLHELLRIPE